MLLVIDINIVIVSEGYLVRTFSLLVRGAPCEAWVVHVVDVVLLRGGLAELADDFVAVENAGEQTEPHQSCVRVLEHQAHLQLPGLPSVRVFVRELPQVVQQVSEALGGVVRESAERFEAKPELVFDDCSCHWAQSCF